MKMFSQISVDRIKMFHNQNSESPTEKEITTHNVGEMTRHQPVRYQPTVEAFLDYIRLDQTICKDSDFCSNSNPDKQVTHPQQGTIEGSAGGPS
jgi:hypothetical protein